MTSREEAQFGFKNKISLDEAMTGREFCSLLQIDYEAVRDLRAADRRANFAQFLDDLIDIEPVRRHIAERLKA